MSSRILPTIRLCKATNPLLQTRYYPHEVPKTNTQLSLSKPTSYDLLTSKRQYSSNGLPTDKDQLKYFIREVLYKEEVNIANNKMELKNKFVKYTSYGMGTSMFGLWSYWFVFCLRMH